MDQHVIIIKEMLSRNTNGKMEISKRREECKQNGEIQNIFFTGNQIQYYDHSTPVSGCLSIYIPQECFRTSQVHSKTINTVVNETMVIFQITVTAYNIIKITVRQSPHNHTKYRTRMHKDNQQDRYICIYLDSIELRQAEIQKLKKQGYTKRNAQRQVMEKRAQGKLQPYKFNKQQNELVRYAKRDYQPHIVTITYCMLPIQFKFPVGIVNQGCTCYMNSFLQILFHIPKVRQLLKTSYMKTNIRKFPSSLVKLFRKMSMERQAVLADEFIDSFEFCQQNLGEYQDPHQFAIKLFLELEEKKISSTPPKQSINDLFVGKNWQTIINPASENTINFPTFTQISLEVKDNLTTALDSYFGNEEILDYQRKKISFLFALPPILIIQLKRFSFQEGKASKIRDKFVYEHQFDFSKWTKDGGSNPDNMYELFAVVVHDGESIQKGHYYSYIKCDEFWIKFNDQLVTLATKKEVFQNNFGGVFQKLVVDDNQNSCALEERKKKITAYLLVYVKKSQREDLFKKPAQLCEKDLNSMKNQPIIVGEINQQQKVLQNKKQPEQVCINQHQSPVTTFKSVSCATKKFEKKTSHQKQITNYLIDKSNENATFDAIFIDWDQKFKSKGIEYYGLLPNMMFFSYSGRRVKLWKEDIARTWSNQQNRGLLLYRKQFENRRQSLVCLNHKKQSFGEIFKNNNDTIVLIRTNFIPKIDNYIVFVKLIKVDNGKTRFTHDRYFETQRKTTEGELLVRLSKIYGETGYIIKFYYEERGQLKVFSKKNLIIRGPNGAYNTLIQIVIEKVSEKQTLAYKLLSHKIYDELRKQIVLKVRSDDHIYSSYISVSDDNLVSELQESILNTVVRNDYQYKCHKKIAFKILNKQGVFQEAYDVDFVSDLLKDCGSNKIVQFFYSNLSCQQRKTKYQVKLWYRCKDYKYCDPFTIVLSKDPSNAYNELYEKISCHQDITRMKQSQNFNGIRILLCSDEQNSIIDLLTSQQFYFEQRCLFDVLMNQKQNYKLIVIGQQQKIINQDKSALLINNIGSDHSKVGPPLYLQIDSNAKLIDIYQILIEMIGEIQFTFDGFIYRLLQPICDDVTIKAQAKGQPYQIMIKQNQESTIAQSLVNNFYWSGFEELPKVSGQQYNYQTLKSQFNECKVIKIEIMHKQVKKFSNSKQK